MLTNTKLAIKAIATDVKNLAKDIVVTLPKGIGADGREYFEAKKEFREWRKARNAFQQTPADTQYHAPTREGVDIQR